MTTDDFLSHPHAFWQEISAAGTYDNAPVGGYQNFYPASFPDGSQIALPIRERDGGKRALASLIINQASFSVVDIFASQLAKMVAPYEPEIVVALPTLGITLGAETARKLGHSRYVPLGTSRKFWYQDELSVPLRSITSPDQQKQLYMDPRMLPLLKGKRVLLIDDVLSTGTSIAAGYNLLKLCDIEPVVIGAAMLQTMLWKDRLDEIKPSLADIVVGVINTPSLVPVSGGGWQKA
ncbi:MAG: phosphoribosyltransferase [Rhizobiaceae bacterium]|nr:phosphoribosyltransferase [Rhizobiaceae bacterium]